MPHPPSRPDGADGAPVDEVPLWSDEFPLTSDGEELVTRRAFGRYLLAASGVFAGGSLGAALWASLQRANTGEPRAIVDLARVPEGEAFLFRYPGEDDPAMIVHLPGGDLRGYSQKCTHLGCVVFWQAEKDRLYCPCHEGIFDPSTGEPTAGPPDRPLARIDLEVRDGVVWAKGMEA